ncbi:MAG: type II secretion system F family protein [Actinomycetota bacterium]|nr:type II secretion system F family protein [Actinomycetota bacterium]
MNPLQVGAAAGVLVAGGVWCVARAFQRAPRSVAAAHHRMFGSAAGPVGAELGAAAAGVRRSPVAGLTEHLAGTLAAGPAGRWAVRYFGAGLQVVGLSAVDVVSRVLAAAGLMLFAMVSAVAALTAMGMLPLSPAWLVLAVVAAGLAGWTAVHDVATKIERRRRELRHAANDFVQLVAVGLTTDQSVEEAIRFALAVGASDAFDSLRQELHTAPQRGVPVWEALHEFGVRYDVRELAEFAASIERQGTQGVSISDTVASLAAAMRAKALDQLEREADKANANLSGPTIGFVVTTIVFLAYPLAQRISEAFGG